MAQLCYWLQTKVTLTLNKRKPASAPPTTTTPRHRPRRTRPCVGWGLTPPPPFKVA